MSRPFQLEVGAAGLLAAAGTVASAATLAGFAGLWWWGFDLASHFRV